MKQTSKLICLLLALLLTLPLAATAFATTASGSGTDNDGTITITNTVKDKKYTVYRIFDLESFSDSDLSDTSVGAYSYKVSTKWQGFFTAPADGEAATNGRKYVDIDEKGYVTWKAGASAADFAKDAIAFAEKEGAAIAHDGQATSSDDNATVIFDNLPLGYYLVKSDLGALCALTTTNKKATVSEKNAAPSFDKKVKEGTIDGGADNWADQNDASVGDTVEFCATITVEGEAKGYVMHDTMEDGLTFGSVTKVTLNDNAITLKTDYTVTSNASHTKDATTTTHTFDVTFTEDFCKALKSGDIIRVYYTATLNGNAVVKDPEDNTAYLSYKDKNDTDAETAPSSTKTYTWQIPVLKYQNGDPNNPLAGAKFKLYKTETTAGDGTKTYSNPVKFIKKIAADTTSGAKDTYQVSQDTSVTGVDIVTGTDGFFNLDGLDSGTYYLKEEEAPLGYNKLDTVVTVTISDDGKINVTTDQPNGATQIEVENKSGAELPTTGGIGTTLFYVIGGILAVGAGVLLVVKKRMSAE